MANNDERNREVNEEARRVVRRRAMKAGMMLIPTVLTLRARPAMGQSPNATNHTGRGLTNR